MIFARPGKISRDFTKWSDDAQNIKPGRCFVVFHGTDFNLKSLSVVALSEHERELWVRGLGFLVEDIQAASYRYTEIDYTQ